MADRHIVVVDPSDNVATAIRDVESGETVEVAVGNTVREITVGEDIAFGHKLAIADIDDDETVRKYGKSIGNASTTIEQGAWVHDHNVESNYGRGDLAQQAAAGGA